MPHASASTLKPTHNRHLHSMVCPAVCRQPPSAQRCHQSKSDEVTHTPQPPKHSLILKTSMHKPHLSRGQPAFTKPAHVLSAYTLPPSLISAHSTPTTTTTTKPLGPGSAPSAMAAPPHNIHALQTSASMMHGIDKRPASSPNQRHPHKKACIA